MENIARSSSHGVINNLGENQFVGEIESVKLFVYRFTGEGHFQIHQNEKGFIPLQRIKGV